MTWLYLTECEDSFNALEKRPTYAVPEFKEGFGYGWRAACRFLETPRPEEQFTKIGILHRRRSGDVDFHQEADVIPLGLHETLDVYMRKEGPS